jgi:hypothetical protein
MSAPDRYWLLTSTFYGNWVPGDPDPTKVLGDFKSYGSRALTAQCGNPASDTWWTYGGSKRKLPNEAAVLAAIEYVRSQHDPLVVWIMPEDSGRDATEGLGALTRPRSPLMSDVSRAVR